MKNISLTSGFVLGFHLLLSNPVYAVNNDGIYTGYGIVSPGSQCLGSSYYLETKVSGDRFETLVTRKGGTETNSQFIVSGNIDSSGKLKPDIVGGRGSNLFFIGQIRSENITGSSGGNTNKTRCVWTYTLSKEESKESSVPPIIPKPPIPQRFPPRVPVVANPAEPVCVEITNARDLAIFKLDGSNFVTARWNSINKTPGTNKKCEVLAVGEHPFKFEVISTEGSWVSGKVTITRRTNTGEIKVMFSGGIRDKEANSRTGIIKTITESIFMLPAP